MQPQWRFGEDGKLLRVAGALEDLRRPGTNGLLSVIAALFFWGVALGANRAECSMWSSRVKDLEWVFKTLVLKI